VVAAQDVMDKYLPQGSWEAAEQPEFAYPVEEHDAAAVDRLHATTAALVETLCSMPEEGAQACLTLQLPLTRRQGRACPP